MTQRAYRKKSQRWVELLQTVGMTQGELNQRLGWYEEKISRFVHGDRQPTRDQVAEIAYALGVDYNTAAMALSQCPEVPMTIKACPWCGGEISIPGEDIFEAMENAPLRCPHCRKLLTITVEDDDGTPYFWFTRED